MQKMMAERGVARFLIAPAGFGKSSLALQYAEEIIGLARVWWIDAQDPCFLRDLDNGRLDRTVLGISLEGQLAVFEDVPYLDDERSRAFSQVIDDMLERGWEVVVTTCPLYDSFAERQPDRVLVGPFDFMLDDAELSAAESSGSVADLRPSERIGALVWGGDAGMAALLEGMDADGMPAEMQLAMFVMLTLQDGLFEEVSLFTKSLKRDVRMFMGSNYPYAGIDLIEERFSTCRLSVEQLLGAFGSQLDRMAEASALANADVLVMRLAGELVHRRCFDRACDLVTGACGRRRRSVWLEEHQSAMLAACALVEAEGVLASLGEHPVKLRPAVMVHAAMRSALLGDLGRASEFAVRVLGQPSADMDSKVAASLICQLDAGSRPAQKGREFLASKVLPSAFDGEPGCATALLASAIAAGDGDRIAEVAESFAHILSRSDAAVFALAAALSLQEGRFANGKLAKAACPILEERAASRKEPDLAEALLFAALTSTHAVDPTLHCIPRLASSRIAGIDRLLGRLDVQRRMHVEGSALCVVPAETPQQPVEPEAVSGLLVPESASGLIIPETGRILVAGGAEARTARLESPAFVTEMVPTLYVRLFGGMEVWLGDSQLDPRVFTKQKAKTLLAVLVLHGAQEVPRRRVMDIMWPTLVGDSAVNNFYSMWSVLRRALSLEGGNCPYLVKQQASCMLDRRYVASDVDRFDELCRKLLFEKPDAAEWSEIHMLMSRMYAGDLLPSEMKNEYIMSMRTQFRSRLVDALVAAGNNLLDEGEAQAALWFVRSAISHDDGREDVYRALIRAQIMSGQRAAAIESYLHCRKVLNDRYGMEVSPDTQALYDSLVMSGA